MGGFSYYDCDGHHDKRHDICHDKHHDNCYDKWHDDDVCDNHNHCHLFYLNGDNYGWRGFPCQDRDNDDHDNYHDNYHDNCHENHDIMIIAVIMILVSQSTPHFNGSDW